MVEQRSVVVVVVVVEVEPAVAPASEPTSGCRGDDVLVIEAARNT